MPAVINQQQQTSMFDTTLCRHMWLLTFRQMSSAPLPPAEKLGTQLLFKGFFVCFFNASTLSLRSLRTCPWEFGLYSSVCYHFGASLWKRLVETPKFLKFDLHKMS